MKERSVRRSIGKKNPLELGKPEVLAYAEERAASISKQQGVSVEILGWGDSIPLIGVPLRVRVAGSESNIVFSESTVAGFASDRARTAFERHFTRSVQNLISA